MSSFGQRFFDMDVIVENIIWLAGCAPSASEELNDFLDDPDEAVRLFGCTEEDTKLPDEFVSWCARKQKMGFLAKAKTPVPHDFSEHSFSCSWGWCQTKWFYTDALDETFVAQLEQWRESVEQHERFRAANPQPDRRY